MKWTKILPDGKGGYNVFDNWTHGHEMMRAILPLILLIPVILVFTLFLPLILWILIPGEYVKTNHEHTFVALGLSFLFFLDYTLGGLLWVAFNCQGLTTAWHFFGALHIVFIIINLIRLKFYYELIEISAPIVIVGAALLMYFGYGVFSSIAEFMSSDTPCFWIEEYYYKTKLEFDSKY